MPTYDYRCDACEHQFEEFQTFSEEVLKKCPKCGKKKLQRLLGAGAGIIFKGSGFYQTDYRSSSYQAAAKADQDAGKSSSNGTTESGKNATPSETGKCAAKNCKCDD